MSFVRLGLSPRADGLSRAQAQAHWRGVHARLFAQVPGVRSYVQNHAVLDASGEPLLGDPGFDIFSEVEFDNPHDMQLAMASSWYRDQVGPDERKLLDASRRGFVVIGGATGPGPAGADCKLVAFVQGRLPAADLGFDVQRVHETGGAAPRPVDAVLVRWCASPRQAEVDFVALRESIGRGARIEAAVIVRENEVVARKP